MNARVKAPLKWEHGRFVVFAHITLEDGTAGSQELEYRDDAFEALDMAAEWQNMTGVAHGVRDRATGEVLA